VSEASLIVQEAADEDANIIFGAVVDPALKGKVKITVIATGFGHHSAARPVGAPAMTPVDLSAYVEPRLRADAAAAAPPAADRTLASRLQTLSTGRRATIDLPLAASAGHAGALAMTLGKPDGGGNHGVPAQNAVDQDFDLNSRFDVPAFLRRQEN
jgi:cell division protein FtsZ